MTFDAAIPQSEHFHIGVDPADVAAGYAEHRRRFASSAARLADSALGSPSRCNNWSVADVLRHGCDVDRWLRAIWAGDFPFDAFDPRITPHEQVLEGRSRPDVEVRDRYVASAEDMAAEVEGAGPGRWGLPSLSFAGAVPWWQGLLHAFFDSWIHERDVLLPLGQTLGQTVDEFASETTVVFAYTLAIVMYASRRLGDDEPLDAVVCGFRVTASAGPVVVVPVPTGSPLSDSVPVLTGDRPLVIDALSGRGNPEDVLTGDRDVVRRLGVLARYFTPTG